MYDLGPSFSGKPQTKCLKFSQLRGSSTFLLPALHNGADSEYCPITASNHSCLAFSLPQSFLVHAITTHMDRLVKVFVILLSSIFIVSSKQSRFEIWNCVKVFAPGISMVGSSSGPAAVRAPHMEHASPHAVL